MAKKVFFKNSKGQKIVGLLQKPTSKPPFPAVVICHGFKGYKEQLHLQTLASQLKKSGFAVLRFDFTNEVGESFGKLEDITFSQGLKDLRAAVNFIANKKFVDKNRIGIVGHSLGGQMVVHYAPSDKRVKAVVGLAGSYYRGEGKTNLEKNVKKQMSQAQKTGYFYIKSSRTKKIYKIKLNFYFDLLKHNTPAQARKIKVPTLLVHGTKDSSVRLVNSRHVIKLLKGDKKLAVIKDAPHTWRGSDDPGNKFQKEINPLVADWFKKYL